ncbi:hypothetical protein [Methylophaga sp.]|uniref:hypothetical protein n=1 Tax=Methylophaga sp. TaxID=2024840 RepID=UPI003A947E00
MQKIATAIPKSFNLKGQQQEPQPVSTELKNYDDVLLKEIFSTFVVVYGASFERNLATDELTAITKQLWIKALRGLSRQQIRHGLDNLVGDYAIPPHKFREICLQPKGGSMHNTLAYKTFDKSKAIELKPDKDKAKKALSGHRRILSGQLDAREKQRQLDDARRLLFGGDHNG